MLYFLGASSLFFMMQALAHPNPPELKPYQLEIKTSYWIFAGTDSNICFRLIGLKDGQTLQTSWKCTSGHGGAYERGSTDHEELLSSQHFDSLTRVEARVVKAPDSNVIDHWKLNWIRVAYSGIIYRAFFYTTFKKHMQIISSYEIQLEKCPAGFDALEEENNLVCKDRDECKEYCNKPAQICENVPGGYICQCQDGFETIGDSCEDINECYYANLTDCYGRENTHCVNTKPGYTCACNRGYKGNPCRDVNECSSVDLNGCQQQCKNTNGSYKCLCKKGFLLGPDGKTCIEATKCEYDPCNTTTSRCFDISGSYECQCLEGYVNKDGNKDSECVRRPCFPLTILDPQVNVSPSSCAIPGAKHFGDICKFSCQKGYVMHRNSAEEMKCDVNGIWAFLSGGKIGTPNCIPTLFPKLPTIDNGYYVPNSCSETGIQHGGSCTFYCNNGYKVVGNNTVECENKKFIDYKNPSCVQMPKIECPDDVTASLPIDENTVSLGSNYIGVVSNMPDDSIRSLPEYVSADYNFPLGETKVEMFARNVIGDEAKCSFRVHVKDTSPPTTEFCPQDMTYTTRGTNKIHVKWEEPRFVDNVGIAKIRQTQKNDFFYSPTSFNVVYDAIDVNGNLATCEFTVFIKVITCSFDSIEGGDQAVLKYCTSMSPVSAFCTAQCPDGKVFHQSPRNGMKNSWWCFNGHFNGIERIPDCVDQLLTGINTTCPRGSISTFDYRDPSGTPACGKCPRGTKYVTDSTTAECVSCPRNTFQNEEGKENCQRCTHGFGTKTKRNVNRDACVALCPPGFHSPTGFVDHRNGGCIACKKPFYTFAYGSVACSPCPDGTIAQNEGAESIEECLPIPKSLVAVPSTHVSVLEKNNVTISCVSYNHPPQKLAWKDIPQISAGDSRFSHKTEDSSSKRVLSYTITNAQLSDAREYVCEATDTHRNVTTLSIDVQVTPLLRVQR